MIVFGDSGPVAMDLDPAIDPSCQTAMPKGFDGLSSGQRNFLTGSFNRNWGKLPAYPVKIDGDDLLIGIEPLD
jgi:hypothetical protein